MHDPNMKQMGKFLFVMSLAMMASQSGTYMNICTPLFIAQYGWEEGSEEAVNEALMNTLPAIGTIFGSGLGAKLIGSGRARGFIVAMLVGIFGTLFTFIQNWYVFLFAKFIVGAHIGMTGVTVARYIEEYVPVAWFETT